MDAHDDEEETDHQADGSGDYTPAYSSEEEGPEKTTLKNSLNWKEFFGSSVELAPSLLTIYDKYAASSNNKTVTFATCETQIPSYGATEDTATTHPQDSGNKYENSHSSPTLSSDQRTPSVGRNHNCLHHVVIENSIKGLGRTDTMSDTTSQLSDVPEMEPSSSGHVTSTTLTSDPQGQGPSDAKKRPLSISSTSSSTSSTSSLPRHQRKKVATHSVTLATSTTNNTTSLTTTTAGTTTSHCPPIPTYEEINEYSSQPQVFSQLHNHRHHLQANGDQLDDSKMSQSDCDSKSSSLERDQDLPDSAFGHLGGGRSLTRDGVAMECEAEEGERQAGLTGCSYIDKVVDEILDTERTYVRDLRDTIQGYLIRINQCADDLNITEEEVAALFGNIEAIYDFNREFLGVLEECEADPVAIAQCFVTKNEGFVIYSDYCTNYPRSVEVLTMCMREPDIAEVFKQQQVALRHGLPLGSYLLKPVQRVLKYHLLLQNILNNYEESWSGYNTVLSALESMTCMAQHINDMKRKHEHLLRIQEVQSLLYGWDGADLTTFGELVLEDVFRMHGAKAWRQVFLFEKGLLVTKKKEDGNLLVKDSIMCSNLMLIESIPKDPLSFHVIPFDNPRMQHTVQAKNLDQKRLWCQEIKRLILESYAAVIPDKAKELVMKLGKSREEEDYEDSQLDGSMEQGSSSAPRKQHQAPEYLERRRGRRRSTSIIPDFGLLKSRRSTRQKPDHSSPKSSPRPLRKIDSIKMSLTSPASAPRLRSLDRSARSQDETRVLEDGKLEEDDEEDDEEEEESPTVLDEEGLSMTPNPPAKKPTLARSESLSSCHEPDLDPDSQCADPDSRATSYDDASSRAKRLSQVLDEEGLSLQLLGSSSQQELNWDKDIVSSVLNVSSVKRAESFRIATDRHRLDSTSAIEKDKYQGARQPSDSTGHTPRRASRTIPGGVVENNNNHHEDDYVSVVYDGDKYDVQQEYRTSDLYANVVCANNNGAAATTPTTKAPHRLSNIPYIDDNYGDYIQLASVVPTSSKSRTPIYVASEDRVQQQNAEVIANHHAHSSENIDSRNQSAKNSANSSPSSVPLSHLSKQVSEPCQRLSSPNGSPQRVSRLVSEPAARSSQLYRCGNTDTGAYDNWQVGIYDNMLIQDISQQEKLSGTLSRLHGANSPVTGSMATLQESCLPPSGASSPRVKARTCNTADLRSSRMEVEEGDSNNPWVLRTGEQAPSNCEAKNSEQCQCPQDKGKSKGRVSRHSSNANQHEGKARKKSPKKFRRLFRSNSFSSVDDLTKSDKETPAAGESNTLENGGGRKGHRRLPSDTVVFTNRSAFLATGSPRTIQQHPSLERRLARLATPPRELGPDDLIRQVHQSREYGKVVMRYGTPPRTLANSAPKSETASSPNNDTVLVNKYTCKLEKEIMEEMQRSRQVVSDGEPGSPFSDEQQSPLAFDGLPASKDMWSSVQDYLKQSSPELPPQYTSQRLPQYNTSPECSNPSSPTRHGLFQRRPGSFHGLAHYSTTSPSRTPSKQVSSPASVTSNDSIMDSLKNAVMNLTSRITGRNPRSVDSSPCRTPRARSAGAIEDLKIDHQAKLDPKYLSKPAGKQEKEKKKDKKHRFVYSLARAYSDRMKKGIKPQVTRKREKSEGDNDTDPGTPDHLDHMSQQELTDLLQDNQQGSNSIGERMAKAKPVVLGTYTLPRHRPPRPKKGKGASKDKKEIDNENTTTCENGAGLEPLDKGSTEQQCASSKNEKEELTKQVLCMDGHGCDPSDLCDGVSQEGASCNNDELCDGATGCSSISYDDDAGCDDEEFLSMEGYYERKFVEDLENLSDEAFMAYSLSDFDSESRSMASTSDQCNSLKQSIRDTVRMIEQRYHTKAIQKIEVKKGEKAQGFQNIMKHLESGGGNGTLKDSLMEGFFPERPPYRSVGDRTRELLECATLTRIRQNSCSIGEDHGRDMDGEEDVSPLRKGWVKFMVENMQRGIYFNTVAEDDSEMNGVEDRSDDDGAQDDQTNSHSQQIQN